MNLHLATDDKFLDIFIENQEEVSELENNKYIVHAENPVYTRSKKVLFAKYDSEDFWYYIGTWERYERVYIHYFESKLSSFVTQIPKNIKVIWVFWGMDAFYLPKIKEKILLPRTKKTIFKIIPNYSIKLKWAWKPINLYREYQRYQRLMQPILAQAKAIKRIDYFAHYIHEDYLLVRKTYKLRAKYLHFHYGAIKNIVNDNKWVCGNNILLGNSAAYSNNHLEAIDLLSQFSLNNQKVYCPLSYSIVPDYQTEVIKYGRKKLKHHFFPIVDFLPKEEYETIINTCEVAIMNHLRSQAAGNILMLLYKGATVYMQAHSSLYKLLKTFGFIIFPIDSIKKERKFVKLSEEEREHNREKTKLHFGEISMKINYIKILNI